MLCIVVAPYSKPAALHIKKITDPGLSLGIYSIQLKLIQKDAFFHGLSKSTHVSIHDSIISSFIIIIGLTGRAIYCTFNC